MKLWIKILILDNISSVEKIKLSTSHFTLPKFIHIFLIEFLDTEQHKYRYIKIQITEYK